MSTGAELIAAERERQIAEEGYTAEDDRGHHFSLMSAARCYVYAAGADRRVIRPEFDSNPPSGWPWAREYWKPTGDRVRDLTKAGALIAAAIDALLADEPVHASPNEGNR